MNNYRNLKQHVTNQIQTITSDIEEEIINIRRTIHKNPELGNKEFKTSELIKNKLTKIGYTEIESINNTGVVTLLNGEGILSNSSKTVMFRADIDALPIKEETNHKFKSTNENMHACGHDAHAAWGLGVAEVLYRLKHLVNGKVKFVFQPAEEIGGAKKLIELGVLENPKVDIVLGGHVWPEIEVGDIGIAKNVAMSSGTSFKLTVIGKGGHGAEPFNCIDPIAIGSEIYSAIQKLAYKINNPKEPTIISVCSFHSGNSRNIIPDICDIEGTVRSISSENVDYIMNRIEEIADKYTKAYKAKYKFHRSGICFPVINDKNLVNKMVDSATKFLESKYIDVIDYPAMTSDDFSEYTSKIPGLYVYIGSSLKDKKLSEKLHSSIFDLDERLLKNAINIFSGFIIDYLNE
ncbi:M20 metallopeptidase family protein [Metaclostridioides mangenotii]|uniref:M20 metallopeptidase family protein n=1 Tax=Metaclostridioides mangenotii TaxID=1540 RepID=UPI0026E9AC9A|nr:M20 family metallopeptidase [Clostridioides mangenotii]